MAYSDKVIDHYEKPRNVGSLDKKNINVGTGLVGAPAVSWLSLSVNAIYTSVFVYVVIWLAFALNAHSHMSLAFALYKSWVSVFVQVVDLSAFFV